MPVMSACSTQRTCCCAPSAAVEQPPLPLRQGNAQDAETLRSVVGTALREGQPARAGRPGYPAAAKAAKSSTACHPPAGAQKVDGAQHGGGGAAAESEGAAAGDGRLEDRDEELAGTAKRARLCPVDKKWGRQEAMARACAGGGGHGGGGGGDAA